MSRFAGRVLQVSSARRKLSSNIEGGDYYRKTQNQHRGSPENVQCKHFIDFVIFAITAVLAEDEHGFVNQAGVAKRWDATRRMGCPHQARIIAGPPASFLSASRYAL